MNYTKIQKIISFLVLFSFFFTSVFSFPNLKFFSSAAASSGDFYNLVSILVDDEMYSDVKSELQIYAKDIQNNLENTRVIILPIPKKSKPFQIASLNESLYFDGYKGLDSDVDFNSRLIGTVLVGDIVLPIINNLKDAAVSIAPYVDFEDKSFIYDHTTKTYNENKNSEEKFKPEIWHGVISPNTGTKENNIKQLKDFFIKDHDFYNGEGLFKNSKVVINGKKGEKIDEEYKPFVFYYDQFREEKSVHYPSYKGYESYLSNKEDLAYNRYSKALSDKIKTEVLEAQNSEFDELLSKIDNEKINDLFKKGKENSLNLENVPDISTIIVAQKSIKKFIEVFNKGMISDFRTDVHNAGRYNKKTSKVNVDMIPYFISILDNVTQEVVKEANTDIEKQIDDLVINELAKDIKIYFGREGNSSYTGMTLGVSFTGDRTIKSTNFYAGTKAEDLVSAKDCSIYRGSTYNSGQLVEANRGLDIRYGEYDGQSRFFYNKNELTGVCSVGSLAETKGVYSGSSPLNLNKDNSKGVKFELDGYDLNKAILPIFNIAGSKKVGNNLKNPSPKNCLNTNFIKTYEHEEHSSENGDTCILHYKTLSNSGEGACFTNSWNCGSDNTKYNGGSIKGSKNIPSYIIHKSPTRDELKKEVNARITPNLPIDEDRYIDFFSKPVDSISKSGSNSYKKIIYPNFYRLSGETKEDISIKLDKILDNKSKEINAIDGKKIDLKKFLKDKPLKKYKLGGYEKEISYYEFLIFSIYWNSFKNVSAKYKFVMQNYLSDQFGGNEYKHILPKNKSEYEIAYIGAPGDSNNMYIKLDPNEKKLVNPYSNLLKANGILDNNIYGLGLLPPTNQIDVYPFNGDKDFGEGEFECAPPEGVNIFEWIPAVICRLKNMLPPKIGISEGECGVALGGGDDEGPLVDDEENREYEEFLDDLDDTNDLACNGDLNKNGINDCLEQRLKGSSLDFESDSSRYYYGSHGNLSVIVRDKNKNRVYIDNNTTVYFRVDKIFDREKNKLIFDSSKEKYKREKYRDYIGFGEFGIRTRAGKVNYHFSTSHKDADVYFKTYLKLKNRKTGVNELLMRSDILKVEIRGDRLFLTSGNKVDNDIEIGGDYAVADDKTNIYLFNGNVGRFENFKENIGDGNLMFSLVNINKKGDFINFEEPLSIYILDKNNNNIFETSISDFSGLNSLTTIKDSGEYTLIIKDSKGFKTKKKFEIKASIPTNLEMKLGSNLMEKGGAISTNYIVIYDRFNNPVIGEIFDIDIKLDGESILFNSNSADKIHFTTIEGFRAFRLKTTNKEGLIKIKASISNTDVTLNTSNDIRVLGNIKLEVIPKTSLKVGGKKTNFDLKVLDSAGNLLSGFNSRVYLQISKKYGHTTKPYFDIVNGKTEIEFITSKLAGENIFLKFQIEGLKTIFTKKIDILPLEPLKVEILPSKRKFEATKDSYTNLRIELKDIYGNIVFNDNTTKLDLEILDEYKDIISSNINQKIVKKGKAKFKIFATNIPGKAYIKISTNPSLSDNSFTVKGQSPFKKEKLDGIVGLREGGVLTDLGKGFFYEIDKDTYRFKYYTEKKLKSLRKFKNLDLNLQNDLISLFKSTNNYIIHGVGENAVSLETFFFWKASNINNTKYNSLYSVLLGAPYGDVTKTNYLASGMLFDKNNRSLAVTSLLSNPYNYSDIFHLKQDGKIKKILNNSDLTQNIDYNLVPDSQVTYLDLYNESLGIDIGKLYFNFSEDTNIELCESKNCEIKKDRTSIIGIKKSGDFSYIIKDNNLVLTDLYGNIIYSISKKGIIKLNSNIDFNISKDTSEYMMFDVKLNGKVISNLAFNFIDSKIKITRDDLILNGFLKTFKNSLIINLKTDLYGIREVYNKNKSRNIAIYYKDPFEKKNSLNSFASGNFHYFDNFINKQGIGWKDQNKSLLSFSAGKTVGESVQDYQSLLTINLGDPVISLKKKKIKKVHTDGFKKFDRSIGKKLNKFEINGFKVFDYNNDNKQDLLFINSNKYFSLLENENISKDFIDLKNLARVEDLGDKKSVQVGDFTGDGYDDIFFVNNKGNPFILNNNLKDFLRFDLTKQFSLNAKITIAKAFDMDHDGIFDVVTLDDDGKINIFYGTNDHENPTFVKKQVYDGYGIKLNNNIRNDYGLIYFNKVPQLNVGDTNSDLIISAEEFNKQMSINALEVEKLTERIQNASDTASKNLYAKQLEELQNSNDIYKENYSGINEGLLDSLIYVQVPYGEKGNEDLDNIIPQDHNNSEISASLDITQKDLSDFTKEYGGYIGDISTNKAEQTTFIRSQYSEVLGVKVEKLFKDRNGGNLKSGDIVNVTVKIKNTTSHNIGNLVYIEDYPLNFTIVSDSIKNNKQLKIKTLQDFGKILFEGINLGPQEEFEITYNLKTKKFRFGFIDVGLFEKDELGDDLYGDIIFKRKENVCSQTVDLFRSISVREYEKGFKQPSCDTNKLEPAIVSENADNDNNGIPDYIDQLLEDSRNGDMDALKDYAKDKMEEIDVDNDGDGLPDRDDLNPNFGEDEDIVSGSSDLSAKIDELSESLDKLIEGLGCGFGGGACLALPMNWAPLAPGGDPTLYGMPIGNGLQVGEGLPMMSNLTGLQTSCGHSPCCLPSTWPANSQAYVPGPSCGAPSAGGNLGTWSPTNTFRFYYTPTLTLGHGIAACFGGTAIATGNAIPMGVSPIVPGGNCIVAAAPMFACDEEDEDKGDPQTVGPVTYIDDGGGTGDEGFGVINGVCEDSGLNHKLLPETNQIDLSLIRDYLKYKDNGFASPQLIDLYNENFLDGGLADGTDGEALVSLDGGNDETANIDVNLDISSLLSGDFQDVIETKNTRVSAFPDFLMDWVTRQIEEIVTKLTDFPTLFIILPDFDSVSDVDWGDYITKGVEEAYKKGIEDNEKKEQKTNQKISKLENIKKGLECDGKDKANCTSIDTQVNTLENTKSLVGFKQYSGITQVYEFLSSVPIINIEPESVVINIPWIDKYVLEKTLSDWKNTANQWQSEANKYSKILSREKECIGTEEEIEKCEQQNLLNKKLSADLSQTIGSLEQNIAILENWKDFPEKLSSLINKKDERLDQILCNLEMISELIGGRIGKNGKRFKAWVEAFILVKAILKSWQLLADLFIDFDAECHECKNERNDLLHFELKLISFIIPKIPVIQFPKWPDIILDLHNIRLSINISVPDFRINKRPIVLPVLPELKLPNIPNVNIKFPKIKTLPNFEIPELPDLPSLPKIELPDLPPPPKLPKLFGSIEAVLDILKLVAKALCILKKSPFVPEWRSGDQIAFLTERTGYLPGMDFLDISLPQFSYPFVDAIKVTTRVNFEQDVDFLTEMARNIVKPINEFTNNIVNMFQIDPDAFDFSDALPEEIEIKVGESEEIGYKKSVINFAVVTSILVKKLVKELDENKIETIGNKELIYSINSSLNKFKYINDSRYSELRETWQNMAKLNFTKQDEIIEDALDNNIKKFNTVKAIINREKQKNKKLQKQIKLIGHKKYEKVREVLNNDFIAYNTSLGKYNSRTIEKANNLVISKDKQIDELKLMGDNLLTRFKSGMVEYKKDNLLAVNNVSSEVGTTELNACQLANTKKIKYKYNGIYVVEDGYSYKLFDYTENLTGRENTVAIDFDNDGDKDLLYLVDNELFVKENFSNSDVKNYVSLNPLEIDSDDNKFLNDDFFLEAINGFYETLTANKTINFKFLASTNRNINNYRVEFYNRVDKNLRYGDVLYNPENLKKTVIDMISDGENIGILETGDTYKISKNIAYFSYIGSTPGVTLLSHKFTNIAESLTDEKLASITANKKLYSASNDLEIFYIDENENKKQITLVKNSNISFSSSVKIYKISGGDLYIDSGIRQIVKGTDISNYMHMPVLFDTEIRINDDRALTSESHIDIKYYDDSRKGIDLRRLDFYKMYDLGYKSKSYLMNLSTKNDYYYAIMYSFSNGTLSTKSKQVLLSPQLAADNIAPDLDFNSVVRIPVYQTKIIDFSNYIFDNSGIDNIEEIKIEKLNPPNYEILRSPGKIKIKFGKFDTLFKTKIVIKLVDKNGNETKKDIGFEVYSPRPIINNYNNKIVSGIIDENLTNEPINIFRIRGGTITKLETIDNKTKVNTTIGDYDFKSKITGNLFSQDLYLKNNDVKLLDIAGDTGNIKLKNLGFKYIIEEENKFPIIYILDEDGTKIYRQKILLDEIKNINIVKNFTKIGTQTGLYLKIISDEYGYYKNPTDVRLNPGVLAIYRKSDTNKTALFSVFRDGRVSTINNNYKLEYSIFNNYIVYKLIDKHFNRVVAELLLKINNNFIIK